MVALTADIDWAPELIISEMLDIFTTHEIKCTLFCTHSSEVLKNCNRNLFEIGIHPNFNFLLDGKSGNMDDILSDLLNIYPEAVGVRSHSLTQNSTILQKFADKKLLYESNNFMPYHTNIQPFTLWTGMMRLTYNWEDDTHWAYNRSFDSLGVDLTSKGINILNFHPMHIFLNTDNQQRYNNAKKFYQDPLELVNFVNKDKNGTRDLLIKTLEFIKSNNIKTYKLKDIYDLYI
ncbi:MAG: hypothetical protein ABI315_03390 [Bacteroidia bacterium]